MTAPRPIERRRLLTPSENGRVLLWPSLGDAGAVAAENGRSLAGDLGSLCERSLADIARMARIEMLEAARKWTAAYRDVPATLPDPQGMVFLTGHQPQMFHPGVWFKNFTLAELARRHGAIGINLIVDSDVVSETSLSVPGGSVTAPTQESLPFDQPEPNIAFEERCIVDRDRFLRFGERVIEQIRPFVSDPLIAEYWPLVCQRAEATDKLGECLAQARHQLEGRFGVDTLEAPQSRIFSGKAFQWFIAHLLAELPQFVTIHNEAIRDYRRVNRVRSASHPAPELATDGDWLETPFWVWSEAEPQRRRLFARRSGEETVLSNRYTWEARLPFRGEHAVERLLELQQSGVRIRSRAMITTLWARVFLSDLFIHGIGGAKYDEVTDAIVGRFFGIRPPRFMVATATLHLPIEHERAAPANLPSLVQQQRETRYHPERFITAPDAAAIIATKRRWLETPATAENAKKRCQAIRQANESLQPWLSDVSQQLAEQQAHVAQRVQADRILSARDYGFPLFPESLLRHFYANVLNARA